MESMKKVKIFLLIFTMVIVCMFVYMDKQTSAAESDDSAAQEASEKYEAVSEINVIRQKLGLSVLNSATLLDEMAEYHSNYMLSEGSTSFIETPGENGYTGAYPADRAAYVGYEGLYVMEYDNYRMVSYSEFIEWCLQDPYLRSSLLSPTYNSIGFGRDGYYYCMVLGGDGYTGDALTTVYPYAGQTDVSGVTVAELSSVPESLELNVSQTIGVPITIHYYAEDLYDCVFENIEVSVMTEDGDEAEMTWIRPQDDEGIWNTLILFPSSSYQSSTKYTVSVSFDVYQDDEKVGSVDETWSFSTSGPDSIGSMKRSEVMETLLEALEAGDLQYEQYLETLADPDDYCTREEAVAMMIDLLEACAPEIMETITIDYSDTFEDINDCSDEYQEKVQKAYQMLLISDQGRGIFNPQALVTPGEVETMADKLVQRFYNNNFSTMSADIEEMEEEP